jgi:hypothetical protein
MAGASYERLMKAFKDDGGVNYSLYGTRSSQYLSFSLFFFAHEVRG